MDFILLVLLILCVVILSGLVSGTEAAILSINYTKVKEIVNNSRIRKLRRKADMLLQIKENIQRYITTIVILNNLINIMGSIYVGIIASKMFGDFYLGIVSAVLTFLIILFSEILPKIIGERNNKNISLFVARYLILLTKLFFPVIYMFEKIVGFIIKEKEVKNHVSEGEIKEMALLGNLEGSINSYESMIIKNVFDMNDTDVYDIMIPKRDVVVVKESTPFDEIVSEIGRTGFTRFPVMGENDDIVGIINAKDLFKYIDKKHKFHMQKILRPVIYAPEGMKIFKLEQKLKKNRIHMAVVINEHGDFTGIVTLEDIIEEVLGDIVDEFDENVPEDGVIKVNDNKYIIKADYDIWKLNEDLELDLNLADGYSTVNGFIISTMGNIPKVNNKLKLGNIIFRILKTSKKKVLEVELVIINDN